jgi:two-component system NtrC family sensor kinase
MKVNNVKTKLELDKGLAETFIDTNQIKQVFINLLNNANDELMNVGGGTIGIKSYMDGEKIIIEFSDDGPGIPNNIKRKIFDPFFTTKAVGKGTGLGLSISYGIIKSHNGEIYAESEMGVGTKFIVSLPLVVDLREEEGESYSEKSDSILSGKNVLIVDDEESIREFIAELLTGEGCRVDSVSTGTGAIEKIAKTSYNAVLCDMKMPGMSGKELFKHIEENKPELKKKIIFITGDVLNQDTQKFIRKTGSRVIEKPLDINVILNTLEDLFQKN